MNLRHLPNALCVLRILLVGPIVWLLMRGEYALTMLLFAVAAVSDGLDGLLAKRFDWTSELGKFLDPLADKLLLVATYVTLAVIGLTPMWLAGVVVVRDVVIGTGAATYRWLFGPLEGRPTAVSKLNTVCQIVYALAVVTGAAAGWPPAWILLSLGALTFVTTAVSGLDYVIQYSQRAMALSRARRA